MSCGFTPIEGSDFIGDSYTTINSNFTSLCNAVASLSALVVSLSATYTSVMNELSAEYQLPIGSVAPFAYVPTSPLSSDSGIWLLCDGTATYSGTVYSELSAVIGTTYGSGGSGLFAVPDLHEKFVLGTTSSVDLGVDETLTFNDNAPNAALTTTAVTYMIKAKHAS